MGAASHSGLDLCLHLCRVWVLLGTQIGHGGLWRDWAAGSSEEEGTGTHLCHRLGAGLRSAVTLMVTKSSETDSLSILSNLFHHVPCQKRLLHLCPLREFLFRRRNPFLKCSLFVLVFTHCGPVTLPKRGTVLHLAFGAAIAA